jgi:hypothetical protein
VATTGRREGMKVYKVTIGVDRSPFIEADLKNAMVGVETALQETEAPETLTVEVIDMDEQEYKNLPEWSGP